LRRARSKRSCPAEQDSDGQNEEVVDDLVFGGSLEHVYEAEVKPKPVDTFELRRSYYNVGFNQVETL